MEKHQDLGMSQPGITFNPFTSLTLLLEGLHVARSKSILQIFCHSTGRSSPGAIWSCYQAVRSSVTGMMDYPWQTQLAAHIGSTQGL